MCIKVFENTGLAKEKSMYCIFRRLKKSAQKTSQMIKSPPSD